MAFPLSSFQSSLPSPQLFTDEVGKSLLPSSEALATKAMTVDSDSPDSALDRFIVVVKGMIEIIQHFSSTSMEGSAYIKLMINAADSMISQVSQESWKKIADLFVNRAVPQIDLIKERDLTKITGTLQTLFDGLPSGIIDMVFKAVQTHMITPEMSDEIFDCIDSLVRIGVKREVMMMTELERLVPIVHLDDLEKVVKLYFPHIIAISEK